nr:2,3-dihydro-2,3-dihydroxybenzoate dehydrogenase [Kibdelosporangium sp. MJ126-NF4]
MSEDSVITGVITGAITDKVAMVTGGAGGIGTAIAWALAVRGAVVAVVDTDESRLAELTGKLTADGRVTRGFQADVTDAEQIADVAERIEAELGPIDVLVNAAGVLRMGSATDLSQTDWQTTFSVNLNGVFNTARAVVPLMKQRRRGSIVTVASNAARVPRVHMAAYGASKAAAASYTKTLGLELAEYGIRCNVVSPGSTDTDMLRLLWSDEKDRQATIDGSTATYKTGIPLRRIADPGDIAEAVVFLASEHSRHITMQDLCVDGGAVLGV